MTPAVAFVLASALAQTPAPDPSSALAALGFKIVQPLSTQETARLRARVDAEMARSAPVGVLENVTDANGGRVRHVASHLACALGAPGQKVRSPGPDQVDCETKNGDGLYRVAAVRAPAGATLDAVAAQATDTVRREPGFALQGGPMMTAQPKPGSGLPEHRTLTFRSRVDGRERWSRLMVGLVDGWVLTERSLSTAPPQGFSMADVMAEATFGSQMRPSAPTPAPPPAAP